MFGALHSVFLAEVASTVGLAGNAKAEIGNDDQRAAGDADCGKIHISIISSIRHLRIPASEYAGRGKSQPHVPVGIH